MKKIIFMLTFASFGGVEKSLLNLLRNFNYDKYVIDIAVLNDDGELLKFIPHHVNVINVDCFNGETWNLINDNPWNNLKMLLKKGYFFKAIIYCAFHLLNKETSNKYRIHYLKWLTCKINKLPTKYDVAIAYEGPNELIDFFVCYKINATKKISWIHFDVSRLGCPIVSRMTHHLYDKICVVSNEAKSKFINKFPNLAEKTITFYNQILVDEILNKANDIEKFANNNSIKIVTVGRITEEKGQTLAIETLKVLINRGYYINWYFIGDGKNRVNCENLAKILGVQKNAFFEGNQINPYSYMKNCDVYVQPSFHEGFCMTLAEALCFNNPIVCTEFSGAREQLINRENSIITQANPQMLADAIIKALSFPKCTIPKADDKLSDINKLLEG